MKIKLIAVLITVAALFIGAVLWRTDSFIYGDRLSWVEAQTRTQMGSLSYALNAELKSLQRLVVDLRSEDLSSGSAKWNSLNPYFAVAGFNLVGDQLQQNFYNAKKDQPGEKWNSEFIKAAIGSLKGTLGPQVKFIVKPFQEPQSRNSFVALIFLENSKAVALFGKADNFQSLIDAQKGSISHFSLATQNGLTVAHTIPEYAGTNLSQDVVFQEALKTQAAFGTAVLNLKKDVQVFGAYEVIPQTNLLLLSSAPMEQALQGRQGLWMQFILLGLGIIAVGAAGALWIIRPAEKRIEDLEVEVAEAAAKSSSLPVAAVSERVVIQDPEEANKVKLEAATQVSAALAHEMRGPLASILGYTQMIVAKSKDEDVIKNTDSILREARAARSVIEKLLGYAGEEVREKTQIAVEAPLAKALKELEATLNAKGVKIVSDYQSKEIIELDVQSVSKAIGNLLQNSIDAMERMQNKEITIKTFDDESGVHLTIEDTGEGIESENINKVFDPFFTTRSFQNHMGLGLSAAYGVLKEHNGEVKVESQRGQGTKISICFKYNPLVERMSALPKPPPAPRTDKKMPPPPPAPETSQVSVPPSSPPPKQVVAATPPPPPESKPAATPPPAPRASATPPPAPPEESFTQQDLPTPMPAPASSHEERIVIEEPDAEDEFQAVSLQVEKTTEPELAQDHTEAASTESAFAEEKTVVVGASPVDVNIESLLEDLPEASSVDNPPRAQIVGKVMKKVKVKKEASDDELTFIDGFLDEDREVEVEIEVEQEVAVDLNHNDQQLAQDSISASSDLEKTSVSSDSDVLLVDDSSQPSIDTNFVSQNKILPPKPGARKKTSELDNYKVEIRKPGKRV